MKEYQGSCHCGEVTFSFQSGSITKGLRCNCSICVRKGTLMSADMIAYTELKVHSGQKSLSLYQFETNVAKHYFCKVCGIYPFHETRRKPGFYRVNLGCIKDIDLYSLEVDVFDGKAL